MRRCSNSNTVSYLLMKLYVRGCSYNFCIGCLNIISCIELLSCAGNNSIIISSSISTNNTIYPRTPFNFSKSFCFFDAKFLSRSNKIRTIYIKLCGFNNLLISPVVRLWIEMKSTSPISYKEWVYRLNTRCK